MLFLICNSSFALGNWPTGRLSLVCHASSGGPIRGGSPLPRPSDAPFGASPGPACGGKEKPSISTFFSYHPYLTFHGGGAPGPSSFFSAATPLRARGTVAPMRGRLLSPFTCMKHKLWRCKSIRTFVGTPRGCGFHPSDVDA